MKTYIKILFCIVAVMLLATSCRKDSDVDESQTEEYFEYDIVPYSITVGITPMSEKIDSIELKRTFDAGDIIEISNPKVLAEPAILTSDDCIGKETATFSGELKVKVGAQLISGSTTLTAALKNTASINLTPRIYNNGRSFTDATFKYLYQGLSEFMSEYSYWACENFTYNPDASSIKIEQKTLFVLFDIPMEANIMMTLGRAYHSTVVDGNSLYAVPFGTKLLFDNDLFHLEQTLDTKGQNFYKISVPTPEDCLPQAFSVSDDKQVFFSKGNLQYNVGSGDWRVAPHQYDRCFDSPTYVGDNYTWTDADSWTDLFGWGTWIKYGCPNMTSEQLEYYDFPCDESRNLVGTCAFDSKWSVLTKEEWNYLLYERNMANNKIGWAKISDVEGLVVLPDAWTMPDDVPYFISGYSYGTNNYSIDDWAKMEASGALFLPIAGTRDGAEVNIEYGSYWTSQNSGHYQSQNDKLWEYAWRVDVNSSNVSLNEYGSHSSGSSVRLVYDVQNSSIAPPEPEEDRCIAISMDYDPYLEKRTQFAIKTYGVNEGDKYELSMSVKADYTKSVDISLVDQSGWYVSDMYVDISSYPEVWQDVKEEGYYWGYEEATFIAFDLTDRQANTYYFDNISLKINGVEVIANGDCSTEDRSSFVLLESLDGYEFVEEDVTFVDKASIGLPKPRDGAVIYEADYTTFSEYPFYRDDDIAAPSFDSENGLVSAPEDSRFSDDLRMFYLAEDIPLIDGKYSIILEIKGDEPGFFNVCLFGQDGDNGYAFIEFDTEWSTLRFPVDRYMQAPGYGSMLYCNLINMPQTIYIRSLQVVYEGD